jgi:hypothetical protein
VPDTLWELGRPQRIGEVTALPALTTQRGGRTGTPPCQLRAAAMIDLLVRHAEVVALKGDSYRLKDRDRGRHIPSS